MSPRPISLSSPISATNPSKCSTSFDASLRQGNITVLFQARNCETPPNFETDSPPLIGSPLLHIQYISSCPPYLETGCSSVRNLKNRHAVVTATHLSPKYTYVHIFIIELNRIRRTLTSPKPSPLLISLCILLTFVGLVA